ncbi:MAG: cytochrome c maturation protein CcmE, partial [Pseudomonadota bacterium]
MHSIAHLTKRKRRVRMIMLFGLVGFCTIITVMVTLAFRDNIVFFYGPSEIIAKNIAYTSPIRIGGLVKENSLIKDGANVQFVITDTHADVSVTYRGILPNLFREGQGVVAKGIYDPIAGFRAQEILAKHDEN